MKTGMSEARTVKISEATTLITRAFKKKRPVFLWGPPGIGKSELVQTIGDSGALGNALVIDMRLALFEPTDLRGYPVPNMETGVMQWLPPAGSQRPEDQLYVVDPMGNLMLRFPANMDAAGAAKAKRDLDRLLRASGSWDVEGR